MKAEKTKEYLGGEISITRIRLIIFIIGIVITIFMQTSVFEDLNVAIKVIIIGVLFGVGILFKVDFTNSKEIGMKIMKILKNRSLNWEKQALELGDLGMSLLHESGVMWSVGMEEQFPEKPTEHIYKQTDGTVYTATDTSPTTSTTKEE